VAGEDVTRLLQRWSLGDRKALDGVVEALQAELRRLAASYMRRERAGHTLQATALVNEAYLRLVDQNRVDWKSRAHFFGIAAQVMRRLLVDHARRRSTMKRDAAAGAVVFDDNLAAVDVRPRALVALDDALRDLERLDPRQAKVVELRYFAGLDIEEVAELLGISPATVKRDWATARAWLHHQLAHG
jgi:RNA polymerase sigma factor (TIGR02999 family)